jgi:uncharacterized OB-fold protein
MSTVDGSYGKPLPDSSDPLTAPFWAHARARQLAVQRCAQCGDLHFPPTQVCPICLAEHQEWRVVSGRGSVLSWVRFHRAYWPGFQRELPYDVCLITLDEGPTLLSNLVDPPEDGIRTGLRVHAVFEEVTPDVTLPKFAWDRDVNA